MGGVMPCHNHNNAEDDYGDPIYEDLGPTP